VYLILLEVFHGAGLFGENTGDNHWTKELLYKGWGIVTATDISLAWLTARLVFGSGHPAIDYLLLLAVVDDAIGLVIIAVFYPDPDHPVEPIYLLLVLAGVMVAFLLRKWHVWAHTNKIQSWVPYVILAGSLSWIGLIKAHCHPALALVPIVPFMPGPPAEKLDQLNEEIHRELSETVQSHFGSSDITGGDSLRTITSGLRAQGEDFQPSAGLHRELTRVLSVHEVYGRGGGRDITAGRHASIVVTG
jgi:hypothetical protein